MKFDPQQHHRRSVRLRGYDYAQGGGYFVTTCVAQKRCVFGNIENNQMRLSVYGKFVKECWLAITEHYPHVILDEYVIMPNHFHGILIINASGRAQHAAPLHATCNVPAQSLGAIVRSFKSATTRCVNIHRTAHRLSPVKVWQRNYYERIVRDETELDSIRRYIIENPLNWTEDTENPASRNSL